MPTLTETLRTLHRIHRQHSDLKDRLSRGPRQIQVAETTVKKCETDLTAAENDEAQQHGTFSRPAVGVFVRWRIDSAGRQWFKTAGKSDSLPHDPGVILGVPVGSKIK